jgi:hypothetical protein
VCDDEETYEFRDPGIGGQDSKPPRTYIRRTALVARVADHRTLRVRIVPFGADTGHTIQLAETSADRPALLDVMYAEEKEHPPINDRPHRPPSGPVEHYEALLTLLASTGKVLEPYYGPGKPKASTSGCPIVRGN